MHPDKIAAARLEVIQVEQPALHLRPLPAEQQIVEVRPTVRLNVGS
jgi:hypothetical protein